MTDAEESETERLRRQVRAMGAVNEQLHAQLEGELGGGGASPDGGGDLLAPASRGPRSGANRRASETSAWIQQLERHAGGAPPILVRAASGRIYVVEGDHRREVRAGLLVPALERLLGEARAVHDRDLDQWPASAPVEVLEGPKGSPFVIVGGKRWPIRGLPLPHPVSAEVTELFPEGVELNVAATNVSRAQFERAVSGKYHLARARAVLRRHGALKGSATILRRVRGRLGKPAR